MSRVKPHIPPKPNISSFANRLNESRGLEISPEAVADSPLVEKKAEENCVTENAETNELPSQNDRVVNLPECETERVPESVPKTSSRRPGPKPPPKGSPAARKKSSVSSSASQLTSEIPETVLKSETGDVNSEEKAETDVEVPDSNLCDSNVVDTSDKLNVSTKGENKIPVKPPRSKKKARQDSSVALCQTASSSSSDLERSNGSQELESRISHNNDSSASVGDEKNNKKKKGKPSLRVTTALVDGMAEEGKDSPSSSDSGRLYRSPSYEKALEENILKPDISKDSLGRNRNGTNDVGQSSDSDVGSVENVHGVSTRSAPDGEANRKATENGVGDNGEVGTKHPTSVPIGVIQPTRNAPPPPPSKPAAPLLTRKPRTTEKLTPVSESVQSSNIDDNAYLIPTEEAMRTESFSEKPDYVNLQNKSVCENRLPSVHRSRSESTRPATPKSTKQPKWKLGSKGEKEPRKKSVFYDQGSADNCSDSGIHSSVSECDLRSPSRNPNAYLQLVSNSENDPNKPAHSYMNFQSAVKVLPTQHHRPNSELDVVIPPTDEPTENEGASNEYSEIDDLVNDASSRLKHTMDDDGYTMIDVDGESDRRSSEADTDYIYPEAWTGPSKSARISDAYEVSAIRKDVAGSVHVGGKGADSESLTGVKGVRPSSWSIDSAYQSPTGSNLSRSSSTVSSAPTASDDGSEKRELTEDEIKKKKKKAFLTAHEILTSEKTFVDVLRLITQDFITAINNESASLGKQIVAPSVLSQIIKYLPELLQFNQELLEDLKVRIQKWDKDPRVADIFVKKGAFLKLYTNYIRDFNSMVALLDDTRRKNPEFDRAVTGFEASRCAKLALKHYMLKPIQRIPQYRLLLSDYQKQLTEDSPDFKDASTAILIVNEVAEHANESMKYGDNLNKLLEIQNSLIGQFEVIVPGRSLIKEGILMKLSRKEMQPRMFYLFSDVLLYTTPTSSGFKVNNSLPLNTVKVNRPSKEDFQNEFSIISTQRSFTVSARTEQEKVDWLAALDDAIMTVRMRRNSYSQGKLCAPSIVSIEIDSTDFKLGTKAPVWIPDDRVSMCMICKDEFSFMFRRHHCRGCGKVICGKCSNYEAPLRYLQYKTERVCRECFEELHKVVEDMDDSVPDEVMTSPGADTQAETNKFLKRTILGQFRSFASENLSSKSFSGKKSGVLHEVNANDENAEMSGYLHQWKDRKWKKTWFLLKGKVLYTFKASEDAAAEKSMPLLGYEISPFHTYFQGIESNLLFELCHHGMPSIIFKTESPQTRDKWMSAMRSATMP